MPLSDRFDLGDVPASFRPFVEALIGQPDPAEGLIQLLGSIGEKAPKDEARDFALLLRRHLPQSARLDRISNLYIRRDYPLWYVRALNDRNRNAAYGQALKDMVTPDTVVLEAGTGSGLFAMMAAHAGAAHVYTCEMDPHVAAIARENIDRNGLADRITLFDCRCEDLVVGDHLPERAGLFLHEFVTWHFVVPKMGPQIQHLRAKLLVPDAPVLPCNFATMGMLVGDAWPLNFLRVPERVEGFDVGAVNLLRADGVSLPGPVPVEHPLSSAQVLAEFDLLTEDQPNHETRQVEFRATATGTATGVLQWVRHRFPNGSCYENRPELACNWWPTFWPFPDPVHLSAGDSLTLRVQTTDTEIFIDPI